MSTIHTLHTRQLFVFLVFYDLIFNENGSILLPRVIFIDESILLSCRLNRVVGFFISVETRIPSLL